MIKSLLRAVDNSVEHPRDIARRRVGEHRETPKMPITNVHVPEDGRPPSLNVDEILKKSDPSYLIGRYS